MERIEELRKQKEELEAKFELIKKELAALEQFERTQAIKDITLSKESKLIDLLTLRILDPSPEWKSKIDTLINIPTSVEGKEFLRGGDYFEALFQLAIAIGILPQFRNTKIQFYDIKDYREKVPLDNYLYSKTVENSGGKEQGISDISFELSPLSEESQTQTSSYTCGEPPKIEKRSNPFYFISVKGFKREKSIKDKYDIPLLSQQLTLFPEIENKNIIVCVRNKEEFLTRLGRSKIEFLKSTINQVIGYNEVMDAFSTFRTNLFLRLETITPETITAEIRQLFPEKPFYKPSLSMYFHQELITKTAIERIKNVSVQSKPHFMCIGVLPRGGKSFIAGGIIHAHRKLKNKPNYNVLFLTSAINETREQFKQDLIEKFAEFDDFDFIDVVEGTKKSGKENPNKFVFVSRQLSSMSKDEELEKSSLEDNVFISRMKTVLKETPTFDICFFDEAHIGIRSDKVNEQFKKTFQEFRMPILLMTATYKNPAGAVSLENQDLLVWDLQDVKDMKNLATLKLDAFLENKPDLVERYPETAVAILKNRMELGQTEFDIAKPYLNFPVPNFISLTFTPDTIKHLKDTGAGYDYMKAFQIQKDEALLTDNERYKDWGSLLVNREDALRIRQFLTPDQDEGDTFLTDKDRKYRAFNQIFAIAQKTRSRPFIGKPFSMIMFLPFGQGLSIGELCRIWGSFLLESRYWRENFVILTLSTYAKHKATGMTVEASVKRGLCHREDFKTSLKQTIQNVEQEALKQGKGLILLSGDVAKMGISLKCVDIVCMMSNNKDADDIIQKMYRALTDDPPTKKNGFIIDLDLKRIVSAMFAYDMEKSRRSPVGKNVQFNQRIEQLMELCNWGQDAFIQDNTAKTFDEIMNEIRNRVFGDLEKEKRIEYGSRSLADKQFDIIQTNKDLFDEVVDTLQFTTGKRKKPGKSDVLSDANPDIAVEGQPTEKKEKEKEKEKPEVQPLTPEQIKKKIVDIMITFVNALVIKSDESWDGMTFESLVEKYKKDKEETKSISIADCQCDSTQECKPFSNLYAIAFCELKGYAMLEASNSEVQYSKETHERIMAIVDAIFSKSGSLAPDWTLYIESLIQSLLKRPSKTGGEFSRKKNTLRTSNVGERRHTTKRNNIRDN